MTVARLLSAAQIAANPAVKAPVVQPIERAGYPATDQSWAAELARPGIVIDLDRRMNSTVLSACFEAVAPLGK